MAAADFEIWDEDKGRWWPFSIVNEWADEKATTLRPRITLEELFASEEGSDFARQLQPDVQEDWSRGIGLDYDWAPGLYTRSRGYVCPAGHPVTVTLPSGREDAGQIVAHAEMTVNGVGWLFLIQIGTAAKRGAVIAVNASTGAVTDVTPAAFALVAGDYFRGAVVADVDGTGTERLYVMISDGGVQNGRMMEYNPSLGAPTNPAAWVITAAAAFGTNGRAMSALVFWTTDDGVGASRIVTISGPRTISYTRPYGDPMDPAAWVEGVRITGSRGQLRQIAAARTHAFVSAEDGLFDLTETGESPNLMGYVQQMVQPGNGYAVEYMDGAVFYALGQGIDRVMVEQQGMLQEHPGQCAPGWGLMVENPIMGWPTSFCQDQGYLVAAIFNPINRRTYVCYGKSRASLGIESPNPMIWYGPEVVIHGAKQVSRMSVSSLMSGERRLWMSCYSDSLVTSLAYVTLPVAGSPLQDMYSAGTHRYNRGLGDTGDYQPVASLYLMTNTWKDQPSKKIVHQHAVGSRALEGSLTGTRLVEYDRADPLPGSTTWGTGTGIITSPVQTFAPSTPVAGHELGRRIDFVSPNGTATPPRAAFLRSLRTTVWKVAPSFMARTLTLQYGTGVLDRHLADAASGSSIDPDAVATRIRAIIDAGGLTKVREPRGRRVNVRIQQVLKVAHVHLDQSPQQALEIQLEVVVLGSAA